jgi:hypothetical protein
LIATEIRVVKPVGGPLVAAAIWIHMNNVLCGSSRPAMNALSVGLLVPDSAIWLEGP